MIKRNLFSLLFLVITFHVCGQSIPYAYTDTVKLEIDIKNQTLIVKHRDFESSRYPFKIKRNRDSTIAGVEDTGSLLNIINLYAGNKRVQKEDLLQKLLDTSSTDYTFGRVAVMVKDSATLAKLKEKDDLLITKDNEFKYLLWGSGVLLVLSMALLVWGVMEKKTKRKLHSKQQQALSTELIELLNAHFDNSYKHWNYNDPEKLVVQLANEQKALTKERDELHEEVYLFKNDLLKKDDEIKEQLMINNQLEDRLIKLPEKLRNEFNSQQAVEKDRINSLCAKMIERKDSLVNSLRGLDETEAKKELLRFSVAYAEMAVAVLNEIRGKNSGSDNKNIQLLTGNKEPFGKTFDKHTSETVVDKEYILLAKLLSDNDILSIEDVYFNGDKYQQKNQ